MTDAPRVLVVEDDGAVRRALERALPLHGFSVTSAPDGLTALAVLAAERPDVVVLDVGLPGPDGLTTAARLRADGDDVPILFLTARDAVADRVAGLDAGGDDYLVKPFALEELVARLRALLRRTRADSAPTTVLRLGDVVLDVQAHRATRGGRDLALTPTEFRLLELLLVAPGRVRTRGAITDALWEDVEVGGNALDQHVTSLRRKLEAGGATRLVHTVRSVGLVARA
jgi:two-component system, OmpR family, response regulator MprA